MLRRISKENPPAIDELDEVTLRRPVPVTATSIGPYGPYRMGPCFSRPVGPEFMRRSCTFVAEAGWRKSSGPKETKDRQNLALRVRQKAVELGSAGGDFDDGGKAATRVQRLMGNVAGNLKSWSSSEDVRQSVIGAFNRTVSVITQARRSSKANRNSIPELMAVTNISTLANTTISDSNTDINGRYHLTKSASASKFVPHSKTELSNTKFASRNSVPCLTKVPLSNNRNFNQDKLNNNASNNKSRHNANNKNTSNNCGTRISSNIHNNCSNGDDHLFKKPAAPVGYKHYRSSSASQQNLVYGIRNGGAPGNVPRATTASPQANASGKR